MQRSKERRRCQYLEKRLEYISSNENHEDQDWISHNKAFNSISIKEEDAQQSIKLLEAYLTYCQPHMDMIASSHDNMIIHICNTEEGCKDNTRELIGSRATIQKIVQTKVFQSRN